MNGATPFRTHTAADSSGLVRQQAGRVRADLDRAELGGRARRLAEFAVKATLSQGRSRVVIPNRQRVCDLLDIGKNHVATVLCELETSRIVRVRDVADGWELLFFADPQQWLVDWIYSREEMAAFLAELNVAPGQAQPDFGENEVSFEPAPDLDRARATISAAPSVGSQNGNSVVRGSPPVQLTVQRFTASSKRLNGEPLTAEAEAKLMKRVSEFVGEKDMLNWGGDWRKNWVRRFPASLAKALTVLEGESKEGWQAHTSRAAALKDLTRRFSAGEPPAAGMMKGK